MDSTEKCRQAAIDSTEKCRQAAIDYVTDTYCIPSSDNIETDAAAGCHGDFCETSIGVWVKAWLWCPRERLDKEQA